MTTSTEEAAAAATTGRGQKHRFLLFVAGNEPNSRKARDNLQRICREYLIDDFEVETIDVLEDFDAALQNNVLVTPTLIMAAPPPPVTIVGNLSDTDKLLAALRLGGGSP